MPPECRPQRVNDYVPPVAIVLDTSPSMRLPRSMTAAQEQDYFRDMLGATNNPRERERLIRETFERFPDAVSRMRRARSAVTDAVAATPPDVPIGLFAFTTSDRTNETRCAVTNHGTFAPSQRDALVQRVQTAQADSLGTPLATAIEAASRSISAPSPDRPGYLVLVTDGTESCGGDPCAAARAAKARQPGLVINVVDMAGNTALQCIADATGGTLLAPDTSANLGRAIQVATRQPELPAHCKP